VKEDKIPVVFHMELSSQLMCNTICDETGAKKAQLNAVHNISKRNFDRGIGYLELMEKNVDVLREALQGQ
jgi:ABC-type metal ion transport system, periplasmic component/surface adhesin